MRLDSNKLGCFKNSLARSLSAGLPETVETDGRIVGIVFILEGTVRTYPRTCYIDSGAYIWYRYYIYTGTYGGEYPENPGARGGRTAYRRTHEHV
jgi:hypothetical protein